jgi:putative FmdB family regulatory protein
MPLYTFDCARCGTFDALTTIAKRNDARACPQCGTATMRNAVTAAALACMPRHVRGAAEINERNQHEPRHSSQHHHGATAQCKPRSGGGDVARAKAKTFPQKRPWMISH